MDIYETRDLLASQLREIKELVREDQRRRAVEVRRAKREAESALRREAKEAKREAKRAEMAERMKIFTQLVTWNIVPPNGASLEDLQALHATALDRLKRTPQQGS